MKRNEDLFLKDILESILNIETFSKGLSEEDFMNDLEKQSAIVRQLEIIGEAVKNVSDKTKKDYPDIEWRNIAGARDIFIHGYFQVDFERVWEIINTNLPDLKEKISKIREDLGER